MVRDRSLAVRLSDVSPIWLPVLPRNTANPGRSVREIAEWQDVSAGVLVHRDVDAPIHALSPMTAVGCWAR